MSAERARPRLAALGPGILVAATGVGAGDLATAAFAGGKLGLAVLWAVVVGALFKLVLNEGLARWQLATGSTLLEGAVRHLGQPVRWAFIGYLLLWSYFVGSALISACGAAMHAIVPLGAARADKMIYGALHSGVALVLARLGGYRLFARVMSLCIAVMFVVVLTTAVAVDPPWAEVLSGLLIPRIPELGGEGLPWTVALIGGVGGTVTVLCYGYWIREEGRSGSADLPLCRLDLAVGYAMTALFGLAMVIIGSRVAVSGGGAALVVALSRSLEQALGPMVRWAFLLGAWSAIFSSLLGVWQSVPYLFCDVWSLGSEAPGSGNTPRVDTRSPLYRRYLYALATVPLLGLWTDFRRAQQLYAIVGALFIPALALALLWLNGRGALVGPRQRNGWRSTAVLAAIVAFFLVAGWLELRRRLGI